MPGQHSEESNRELRAEIEKKSAQYPGGETAEETQRRIATEHAKRLKESIQGQQLSHVPEDTIDAQIMAANRDYVPDPPSKHPQSPVLIDGVGGKAGQILKKLEIDEPVFILRAKDIFSVMVIAKYLEIVEAYGPSDHEFQRTITETLQDFKDWQGANVDKVRYPD